MIGHVARQKNCAAAGGLDLGHRSGRFAGLLAIVKGNAGTGFRQGHGCRQSDALAGAGHQGDATIQDVHRIIPLTH